MDEVKFEAALCHQLQAAAPSQLRIRERNYNAIIGTKARLRLEADPDASAKDSPQWHLNIAATETQIRCPNCGNAHLNPVLILCYRVCHHCTYVLRELNDVEVTPDPSHELEILAAAYGHPAQANLAVDVTEAVSSLVERGPNERLCILAECNLYRVFGVDPCPQQRKALKIRYLLRGHRGEVLAYESDRPFHLEKDLYLLASRTLPLISIVRATWGHPRGVVKGRGAFDVKEALQYRIDSTNGRYCAITQREDLAELFGNPCQGRSKHLVLEYEIAGKAGELYEYEVGGHLAKDISLDAAPSMAPQIIVERATYGWTEALLAEKTKDLQRQLFDIQATQRRRAMGLTLSADDVRRLRRAPAIQKTLDDLKSASLGHKDVTALLQRRVEHAGGHALYLCGEIGRVPDWARAALLGRQSYGINLDVPDDLNEMFGNPLPGQQKLLKVAYAILGHDADKGTEASETTTGGFESNFIKHTRGCLTATIDDDAEGRGLLAETLFAGVSTTLPSIEVCSALYGHAADPNQVWDVTARVKAIVDRYGGRCIYISSHECLDDLFGDPCRGTRKKLRIRYYVRGFRGRCRIDEGEPNHLRTNLAIGFVSDDSDPFKPIPRRPYRDESIERNMRLRMPPNGRHPDKDSPYAHLGASYS